MKIYKRKIFILLPVVGVLALLGGSIYLGAFQPPDKKEAPFSKKESAAKKDSSGGQQRSAENPQQEPVSRNPGFILDEAGTYTIDDSALNASITVSPMNSSQVKVDINLSGSAQNFSYTGNILSSAMAEIVLDEGDIVNLVWSDPLHLKAVPVNGSFSEKMLTDRKMLSDCLNNQLYTATADEDGNRPAPSSTAVNMPVNGAYYNSIDGSFPNTCNIRIYKADDMSFKFSIWESFNSKGEPSNTILIPENTAVFENRDDTIAVYKGENYTITFDFSKFREIKLSGFDAATQLSDTFVNMIPAA